MQQWVREPWKGKLQLRNISLFTWNKYKTCINKQGVYVGSASPLIADIKTEPYSVITYTDDGMLTGTYDNTHDIPIFVDNGTTLNIMLTHFFDRAYYLHHLPKENAEVQEIQTGNGAVQTRFWIDIVLNVQGCIIQFKLLVCDTLAETGILLNKWLLNSYKHGKTIVPVRCT